MKEWSVDGAAARIAEAQRRIFPDDSVEDALCKRLNVATAAAIEMGAMCDKCIQRMGKHAAEVLGDTELASIPPDVIRGRARALVHTIADEMIDTEIRALRAKMHKGC